MGPMCDFSYAHFDAFVGDCVEQGYRFVTQDEIVNGVSSSARTIFLRHDVDHSMEAAAEMAERERRLGARASYYLLLHGEYDLLSADGLAALRTIQRCGHDIALHYDVAFYDSQGLSVADGVAQDLALLRAISGSPVTSMSAHNPTTTRQLSDAETRGIQDVHSAAGPRGYRYLSDSCQRWREGCACGYVGRESTLHVLIHPIWWRERHTDLFDIIEERREAERRRVDARHAATAEHFRDCLLARQAPAAQ